MAMRRKMIGEFLLELADDPERLDEYARDPANFLRRQSDLTEEQQEILLSRDLNRIRDAIRDEYGKAEVIVVPLPVQHVATSM
jgi:hypothetical protein